MLKIINFFYKMWLIILVLTSVGFWVLTESIYSSVILNYIQNPYLQKALYTFILCLSQSFFILLICKKKNINYLNKIIYILIAAFSALLLIFLLLKVLKFFDIEINYNLLSIFIVIITIMLIIRGIINKTNIEVTNYIIKTTKNINLKIAFVSDIHIGALGTDLKFLENIVQKLNEQNADYIFIGGDIMERSLNNKGKLNLYKDVLKKLVTKNGVIGVLGNHDYYHGESNKIAHFLKTKCNINILKDEYLIHNNLLLIGREDKIKVAFGGRSKLKDIINPVKNKNEYFNLLLDHNPSSFNESVENKIDLQLSGHTHNGQIFPFNLVTKMLYTKSYGLLKKQNSTLIVSSGISTWGPPLKLMSKTEIVVIDIKNIKK